MTSLVLVRGLNTRVLNTVCECTLSKIREWYVKKIQILGKALSPFCMSFACNM